MCFNSGKADRIFRVVLGLGLIGFGLLNASYIVAGVGAIALITGAVGFCPFYTLFKLNTGCKK